MTTTNDALVTTTNDAVVTTTNDALVTKADGAESRSRRYAPRTAPVGYFDRRWAGASATFQALGHRFSVRGHDAHLVAQLEHVFGDLAEDEPADTVYTIVDRGQPRDRYALYVGDERVSMSSRLDRVVGILLWDVNRQATLRADDRLTLVHAAAASHRGLAAVFPAPMESGKTTLVTGLVRAGFGYLSDEVAAFDPESATVQPFPKALSLDPGAWKLFPDLEPRELVTSHQWQVPVSDISGAALALAVPLGVVIAPRYVEGAETRVTPVSRAEMLTVLISSAFHLGGRPQQHLDTLAGALSDAECFRLEIGQLDEAVHAVESAIADVAGVRA